MNEHIKEVSRESLNIFNEIATEAKRKEDEGAGQSGDAFASQNTFTGTSAIDSLSRISRTTLGGYKSLQREPAISRLVLLNEEGEKEVLFISRGYSVVLPSDNQLASYLSPKGRLASIEIGDEEKISLGGRDVIYQLLERTNYSPSKDAEGWDSKNSLFQGDFDAVTVTSLRKLLSGGESEDGLAELDALLEGDGRENIVVGFRRDVRASMGLRDQPILDKFQDEIFRLPIDSRLVIFGPPGTGKTTTLIRRLGQKLNTENLSSEEKSVLNRADVNDASRWIMFTPSDLLKHYLKEAFARENVPASSESIKTWDVYRKEFARNRLGILKSANNTGKFVLRTNVDYLSSKFNENQEFLFDEFLKFHQTSQLKKLLSGFEILKEIDGLAAQGNIGRLGELLSRHKESLLPLLLDLEREVDELIPFVKGLKEKADQLIKAQLNLAYNSNNNFLNELADFIDSLKQSDDDPDTDDEFDDEDEDASATRGTTSQIAYKAYQRTIRSISRYAFLKKKVPEKSNAALVSTWLGERIPPSDVLVEIGRNIATQNGIRRFIKALNSYVKDVPGSYKEFRKINIDKTDWYSRLPDNNRTISNLELDIVLLASLKVSRELMGLSLIKRKFDEPRYGFLRDISDQFYFQVLVDEATDFSSIQLACIFNLSNLETKSFFACGDFNQRITQWGATSKDQFDWVSKGMETRSITTVYRQSRLLNNFSRNLLAVTGGDEESAGSVPSSMAMDGVPPVLIENVSDKDEIAIWLADRISEIESSVGLMPTVAVLVENENAVEEISNALDILLEDNNLTVKACKEGQVLGDGSEIRVFDIQHIKGLEFEAVFFVGLDKLADEIGDLFSKYLYVGSTRAATYLGMTCERKLPAVIEPLREQFSSSWEI